MASAPVPYFDDEVSTEMKRDFKKGTKGTTREKDEFPSYCRQCDHRDCRETRKFREGKCQLCNEQWTAGDHYYNDDEYGTVHANCLHEEVDRMRLKI